MTQTKLNSGKTTDQIIEQAQVLMQLEKWDLAKEKLLSVLSSEPENPFALALLGGVKIYSSKFPFSQTNPDFLEAEKLIKKAVELHPAHPYLLYLLSVISGLLGKTKEELALLRLVISLDTTNPFYLKRLSQTLLNLNYRDKSFDFSEAEELILLALKLDPTNTELHEHYVSLLSRVMNSFNDLQLDLVNEFKNTNLDYLKAGESKFESAKKLRLYSQDALKLDPTNKSLIHYYERSLFELASPLKDEIRNLEFNKNLTDDEVKHVEDLYKQVIDLGYETERHQKNLDNFLERIAGRKTKNSLE